MTHTFHAKDLADIAVQFARFAEGCDRKAAGASTLKAKGIYEVEARVWREAADVLRHTKLKGDVNAN